MMRRIRTGSTEAVLVFAVALLAVLGGAAYFMTLKAKTNRAEVEAARARDEAREQTRLAEDRREEAERALAVADEHANPEEQRPVEPLFAPNEPVAHAATVEIAANLPTVAVSESDPTALVREHVAVGEFGPAIDVARAVEDFDTRAELLQTIAAAQAEVGDFQSSLYTVRALPDEETREEATRETAEKLALAGGAGNADFSSLIDLIVRLTGRTDQWEDVNPDGGAISEFQTGVRVDANGHLSRMSREDVTGRLARLAHRARDADLNADMARPTDLRFVSITRLEREVAKLIEEGRPVPTTMRHLAGLQRIQYVFAFPEDGEIVVAGPAEAWRYNEVGAPVGADSGRPTLQLDDLVTVTRVFAPGGQRIFACSIVPRQDGLKAVRDFVEASNARGPLAPGSVRRWAQQIEEKLGTQDVVYEGIPENSRVANVILEADYRMKLIGIGKAPGVGGMKSFFDLLPADQQRAGVPMDALRWWLTMKYDAVLHSPSRDVFEVKGSSVRCLSENELIAADGGRVQTGKTEETNRLFAEKFTDNYAALAERDLVFADLQNVFDLSLVAALVQKERLHDRCDWDLGCFARGGAYQPADHAPVTTCDSAVNHRVYGGKHIVVQAAGGVRADLWSVLKDDDVVREEPQLAASTRGNLTPALPEARWWWDAR